VGALSDAEVARKRKDGGFMRAFDGHVAIYNRKTREFFDIKCDVQLPGTLLLRDPAGGAVSYISYASIKQIDLSDDVLVAALADDKWEGDAVPIEGKDAGGKVQRLALSREGFYSLFSISGDAADNMPPPPPPPKK